MIVKFFSRGTGGASGVFDYLLKDKKEPDGQRKDAELLRGDVVNQSLLIDSLDFKQKYTSGCLSFAESPDQVTDEQKQKLMDGFEETIRAGLEADRVAVTWIEHRDKGRLELNFVFANVDLKHGRAFQPYVHSQDKRRVNAWKDMANIEHGFKDPNDPANKRLMAQRDNLPRDVKQARQALTEGLTALVAEGVIKSRSDVVKALTDGGFEIARETPKAISIKNPYGNKNIRLTGGIYERDFNFSRDIQEEVERASREHRSTAPQRYEEARQLYVKEIERKRVYHQQRHSQPRKADRTAAPDARKEQRIYQYVNPGIFRTEPSPYAPSFTRQRRADTDIDTELRRRDRELDKTERVADLQNTEVKPMANRSSRGFILNGNVWDNTRDIDIEKGHRPESDLLSNSTDYAQLSAAATKDKLGIQHGHTANRASKTSATSTAGYYRQTETDVSRQRERYSSLEELVRRIGDNAKQTDRELTHTLRAIEEHDSRAEKSAVSMGEASQRIQSVNEGVSNRVATASRASNSTDRAYETVSEYDSSARQANERYRELRERAERISVFTRQNNDFTEKNNQQSGLAESAARAISETVEHLKLVQQQQREEVRASRSYSPSMR